VGVIRSRITIWFVVMLFAIASAVVAFQMSSGVTGGDKLFNGTLLTDPNPDKGNDCPYPPAGGYGSGNSGKVAKGRDKHCNQPTGKGAKPK
jgi:hypothetical protein